MRSDRLSGFLFHAERGACLSLSVEVGGVLLFAAAARLVSHGK